MAPSLVVADDVSRFAAARQHAVLAANAGLRQEASRWLQTADRHLERATVPPDRHVLFVRGLQQSIRGIGERLVDLDAPELHDPRHRSADHPELTSDRNVFHLIRDGGPILLHHPYDSFSSSVERFLRDASEDPKVRAIKMKWAAPSAPVINHFVPSIT